MWIAVQGIKETFKAISQLWSYEWQAKGKPFITISYLHWLTLPELLTVIYEYFTRISSILNVVLPSIRCTSKKFNKGTQVDSFSQRE